MDTETLVTSAVQTIEQALRKDKAGIQLVVAPLDEGWNDRFVIYAKPTKKYQSSFAIIEKVTDKLFATTTPELRRHISHIQVYDIRHQPFSFSPHLEKMFAGHA
ncbi:MAG: hypothetical protein MUF71_05355 [Candidatus Kapabacteria bacterium]|jgi:hypothetical protein|nr:hypothetical protein [Candidatus Kapabacteria bacterium]